MFLRGNCISYSAKVKASRNKRIEELENKIDDLERQLARASSDKLNQELSLLKAEYASLSISKADYIIHRTKQKYYFNADRPSRLLALKLKECESKAIIDVIKTGSGEIITNPKAVNDEFRSFYSTLHSSEVSLDRGECSDFLSHLNLPTLPISAQESLDALLTLEQLHNAAKLLQKGKSPGLDGIPPELYLAIWDIVGTLILKSMNYAIDYDTLHRDQNVAIIALLLKKDKDTLSCSSYRPISLISADVKILAKALILRFKPYIDNLIQYDQTGFLKGCLALDNIHRLLHIIDHAQTTNAIFSLDALKAFDRLEWDYLWPILE